MKTSRRSLGFFLAAALMAATPGFSETTPPVPDATQGDNSWDESGWDNEGWDDDSWGSDDWTEGNSQGGLPLHGFVEGGYGTFIHHNKAVRNNKSLQEIRGRLESSTYIGETWYVGGKLDLVRDTITNETRADFREAIIRGPLSDTTDIQAGRQILTWGTGDLVFLNDLFPKDWESFFNGRQVEYLKKPADGIKISSYHDIVNIDLVWLPEFEPDQFLDGERFSFFDPSAGQPVAPNPAMNPEEPPAKLANSEVAARLFRNINGNEMAFYLYRGFQKQPNGLSLESFRPTFYRLNVIGASLRRPLLGGIGNVEVAHHDSVDDASGTRNWIPNGQYRFLLGYERELVRNLTLGLQYYLEHIRNHDEQMAFSMTPQYEPHENRHVLTQRINWRLMQDNLTLSLFSFVSTNDSDRLLLPSVSYRFDDNLSAEVGATVFSGKNRHSFLGQFEANSNYYARIRYSF